MITKKLTIGIMALLLLSVFVYAAIIVQNQPSKFARITDTEVNFNWTFLTLTDKVNVINYLFLNDTSVVNGTFVLNQSVLCDNNTACNISISSFSIGRYQWKILTVDQSTNASKLSSTSEPFDTKTAETNATINSTNVELYDFITAETNATLNGTSLEFFNFTLNNSLSLQYTFDGVEENCDITFSGGNLTAVQAGQNVTAAGCNISVSNSTGALLLTTQGFGTDEFINVTGGNATNILGFTIGSRVNGDQVGNNTLNIIYTFDGTLQSCTATLSGESATAIQAGQNITVAGCNVSVSNSSGALLLTTQGFGVDESINVSGNATNIFGFPSTTSLGLESGNTSLNIQYTVNGLEENCAVVFDNSDSLNFNAISSNITAVCNLTILNQSGFLNLTTLGHGTDEFINFTSGNSTNIFGFTIGLRSDGTQSNFTSNSSFFDIRSTSGGNLTINLLNDTIVYGTLFLTQPPADCPTGSYITQFFGNASTCTGGGLTVQINTTGACNMTFTGGLLTSFVGCVGP